MSRRNRADSTTPDSTTPDAVDTPTPDATPSVTTADRVSSYVTAFNAAVTADTPDTLSAAVAAYANLPGGARGGARATAIAGAIRAGLDAGTAVRLDDAIPAAASHRAAPVTIDPIAVFTDRVYALLHAVDTLPRPDGMTTDTADGIVAAYRPSDGTPGPDLSDAIRDRSAAAVAAVSRGSRGSGTRQTVTRGGLDTLPDGPVTYHHRGTVHTASIDGAHIVTADGTRHATPTAAASAVNGGVSVNGWTAWTYVADDGSRGATLAAVAADGSGSMVANDADVTAGTDADTLTTPDADSTPDATPDA